MALSGYVEAVLNSSAWKYSISVVVGALIGVLISFTVNCTLVEISINAFFAIYFGVLFIVIAAVLLWRVRTGDHPHPWVLAGFSTLVLLSGFICFFLEAGWFINMKPAWKVPLYSILGVSLCFALMFSIIDLINYCTDCECCRMPKALIETETQVYLVVGTAMVMGFMFGFVFGLFDVEDEKLSNLKVALMREESICYPIGLALGGISAAINQYLRANKNVQHYDPVRADETDPEFG